MTFKKSYTAKKLIKSSVVLERFGNRKRYVKHLIRRLRHIPQILPIRQGLEARTRLDHCNNIAAIVATTHFTAEQKLAQKELIIAAMMHDIGHAPFGHASERAINVWLQSDYFSNDRQSSRLLFFGKDANAPYCLPIFQTSPIRQIADIRPPPQDDPASGIAQAGSYKSRVLDFLDDLENVVGDTGDLCRNGMADSGRLAKELGIPLHFDMADTANIASQVLQRFGGDRSFQSLLSLSAESTPLLTLLNEARDEVMAARLASSMIGRWDLDAQQQTIDICETVSAEINSDQSMPDSALIDIISSVTIT